VWPVTNKRLEPRRAGRPRQTWFGTVESDVAPLNIGLAAAYSIDHKIDRHGGRSWKRQRPLDKPHGNDDDDDDDDETYHFERTEKKQAKYETRQDKTECAIVCPAARKKYCY